MIKMPHSLQSGIAVRLIQHLNRIYSIRSGVKVGRHVHVGLWSAIWAPHLMTLEDHVYIGNHCTIQVDGRIGRFTVIANHVGIIGRFDHDHLQVGVPIRFARWVGDANAPSRSEQRVEIHEDVWVGYGAIVLSGVTVGRGAIVGAGAVVTQDVRPYKIVAGVPAQVVGTRFSQKQIRQHEEKIYNLKT